MPQKNTFNEISIQLFCAAGKIYEAVLSLEIECDSNIPKLQVCDKASWIQ